MTDERVDSDVTLGEVNRNVNRIEKAFTTALEQLVTRREFEALERRVSAKADRSELVELQNDLGEIKENTKGRVTTWIALAGIVIPSVIAVWAVVHG